MKLLQNPPIFGSKKASLLTVGMALIALIMTVLPLVFPDVAPAVWERLAELLQEALLYYLAAQGAVDIVQALRRPVEAIEVSLVQEPEEGEEVA